MSSTNKTTNYNLSQFIGSDKPAWLVDYNGDMSAIDTQMKANADAAAAAQTTANTADAKADTNASAISTLDSQVNGASGVAADVTALQGSVNTINSLIGNGEPTTTDKTLIGAINELDSGKADSSDLTTLEGKLTGKSVIGQFGSVSVNSDGTKTYGTLLSELHAALAAIADTLPTGALMDVVIVQVQSLCDVFPNIAFKFSSSNKPAFNCTNSDVSNNNYRNMYARVADSNSNLRIATTASDGTVSITEYHNTAMPADRHIYAYYQVYNTI